MGSGTDTRAPALAPALPKVPHGVRDLSLHEFCVLRPSAVCLRLELRRATFCSRSFASAVQAVWAKLVSLLAAPRTSLLAGAACRFPPGCFAFVLSASHGLRLVHAFWQRLHRLQRLQPRLQDLSSLHSLTSAGPSFWHFVALRVGLLPNGRAASEGGYPLGGARSGDGSSRNEVYGRYRFSSSAVRLRGGMDDSDALDGLVLQMLAAASAEAVAAGAVAFPAEPAHSLTRVEGGTGLARLSQLIFEGGTGLTRLSQLVPSLPRLALRLVLSQGELTRRRVRT